MEKGPVIPPNFVTLRELKKRQKGPVIPPNFVTLRDLKERHERDRVRKLKQQSTQVGKDEDSEVKGPPAAPVHIKEETKQEGPFDDFPPEPPNYTANQNSGRGGGHPKQAVIIGPRAANSGSTSVKHTTNWNRSRGWRRPNQSMILAAQAAASGSTSNAKKKESDADVAGVITKWPLTGLGCGSAVAMCVKRTKATPAPVESIKVEKEEKSEVKLLQLAPVRIKGEEKQEGYINNFPPKPPKYTPKRYCKSDEGRPKQTSIIGVQVAVSGSTSLKQTAKQYSSCGGFRPKQSKVIGAQAVADGSTSNVEKKELDAEVAGVITELSLTSLGCGSEVAMGEKRMKATAAFINGGKTEGRAGLDIERRISGLHINGRNSKSKGGRGYRNNWQKTSSSADKVWVVKQSLNQKDGVAGNK